MAMSTATVMPASTFIKGGQVRVQSKARSSTRMNRVAAHCAKKEESDNRAQPKLQPRREIMLNSVAGLFLGSVFSFPGERPSNLGLKDYGSFKSLALCPPTPNCISTAEEANDYSHFVPAWNFTNPEKKIKKTTAQAMVELKEAVLNCKEGKFTASIVTERPDYLAAEFQSNLFGFTDDMEFYFHDEQVEYRTASRQGKSDFDANRKRVRALRKELQKKGWSSVGF